MKYKFRCFQLSVLAFSRSPRSMLFFIRHLNFLCESRMHGKFCFAARTQVETSCETFFRVKVDNSLSVIMFEWIFFGTTQHPFLFSRTVQTIHIKIPSAKKIRSSDLPTELTRHLTTQFCFSRVLLLKQQLLRAF